MAVEKYYSVKEVAEKLGVTVQTVRNWYNGLHSDTRLQIVRAGRVVRIRPSDLRKFLKECGKDSSQIDD